MKRNTFWGLSEIFADVESDTNFDARVRKLQEYNENSERRLERLLKITMTPEFSFDRVIKDAGKWIDDFRANECKEHGVLDTTWENSLTTLENVCDRKITNVRVGKENLMFLLEDLQADDAKIIARMLRGQPISQLINYHVLRKAFPDTLPEVGPGK